MIQENKDPEEGLFEVRESSNPEKLDKSPVTRSFFAALQEPTDPKIGVGFDEDAEEEIEDMGAHLA